MNDITRQLKELPKASLDAAVNDPFLRLFWCYFAFIAVLCLVFR